MQRRHPRERRRQLPDCRDCAVGLFARHLPAVRDARCAFQLPDALRVVLCGLQHRVQSNRPAQGHAQLHHAVV